MVSCLVSLMPKWVRVIQWRNVSYTWLILNRFLFSLFLLLLSIDKQQELDLPSLRVDDSESATRLLTTPRKTKDGGKDGSGTVSSSTATAALASGTVALSAKSGASSATPSATSSHVGRTMSHISGVKRPLSHSNSVSSEKVAKYGVDTPNEHELGKVYWRLRQAFAFLSPFNIGHRNCV